MRRPLYSEERSGLKKGTWTAEEDSKLIAYVTRYGCWNWRQLPRFAGLARCGKSCRLRWLNYLRPDIKRGNFTPQEDETIINLHRQLGNRWSVIAGKLPGRTDNEIKNHWHTNLKNKRKLDEIEEEKKSGGAITNSESHETVMLRPITSKVEYSDECDKAIVDNGKLSPEWTCSSESVNSNNNLDEFAFLNAYSDPIMNASFWAQPCMVDSDHIFIQPQDFSPSSNNINPQLWTHTNYYDEYSLF